MPELRWTLTPLHKQEIGKKTFHEQVLVSETNDGYPFALLLIDTFWMGKGGDHVIHDALNEGKTIDVIADFQPVMKPELE